MIKVTYNSGYQTWQAIVTASTLEGAMANAVRQGYVMAKKAYSYSKEKAEFEYSDSMVAIPLHSIYKIYEEK